VEEEEDEEEEEEEEENDDLLEGQRTPASSLCAQLCLPQPFCGHCAILDSLPVQCTLSIQIVPVPAL
jgi:hypothetical protein